MIYTSYPKLGKQGANLVLEVIFRAIKMAMERRGTKKFKTIYVQVDNVSSNKCYTIIAGLVALLLLGVCDKVIFS